MQPSNDAALIMLRQGGTFAIETKGVDANEYQPAQMTDIDHGDEVNATQFKPTGDMPIWIKFSSNEVNGTDLVLRYVHTTPVYRTSAVLGVFSIFIGLFIFVFSWTLFCGGCRATRKR